MPSLPSIDVAELLGYVRFAERDAALVRRLGIVDDGALQGIAQRFYERIREHDEAHAVLRDEEQVARLHGSLVAWMRRLLAGPYDDAYFAKTWQVGRVHVRVGLPQRYMFLAMALIRSELSSFARTHLGSEAPDVIEALDRLLDLELATMLESYRSSYLDRIRRVADDERAALLSRAETARAPLLDALDLAGLLVIGVDESGKILLVNHAVEATSGLARDELVGESLRVLVGEELQPGGALFASVLGKREQTVDVPVCTRSGHERMVRWRCRRLDVGSDVAILLAGHDVTEELVLAETRRRTERLAAVGTLAAGLAHEIRNPLNGAQLHLTFLERRLASDREGADAVGVVKDEIGRLARLVTEFLDFARPRPLRNETVSLKALCTRSVEILKGRAETEQVAIHADLPVSDLVLIGDGAKLEQVLLNLLLNAIEAVAGGAKGGSVWFRARRQPRFAVIEVEDDGPGLSDESAPVFDAFYTTKSAGTGLGLAIAHRIITDHGGTVSVTSRPGKTVFTVRLPVEPHAVSRGES